MQDLKQRRELIETLRQNVVTVTFWKRNDERRVMRCTLRPDMISRPAAEPDPKPCENDALVVWDIDAPSSNSLAHSGSWRSFRFDSIISAEFTDVEGKHYRYDVSIWNQSHVRTTY
jgi:hypothetical protein